MSDNANQTISRSGSENSGNGGHNEQGAKRYNNSGSRNNNRRRRPSQQIGGDQSVNPSQRPPHASSSGQQTAQGQTGRPQNPQGRQDSNQPRRGSRPQKPYQNQGAGTAGQTSGAAAPNTQQNIARVQERPDQNIERQNMTARPDRNDGQAFANRKNNVNPVQHSERPREARNWSRHIRTEETFEDIKQENDRIEKEIWLEIAGIHTYKLD